ncbi:MAG: hypothetical protein IPK35_16455 [Saprospiraceae bacterium]|nr:hypothetical protein [Saprospiraceae bacterium]
MKSKKLSTIFRYVLLIILVGLSMLADAQSHYPCGAVGGSVQNGDYTF